MKRLHLVMDIRNLILPVGVIIFNLNAFFPGYLNPDSSGMLNDAVSLTSGSGWHSSFLTLLWSILYLALGNIDLIWVAQLIFFVISAYFISKYHFTKFRIVAFLGLTLWPSIWLGVMCSFLKEPWAVTFALCALIFCFNCIDRFCYRQAVFSVLFCAGCIAVRVDYLIVAFPILFGLMLITAFNSTKFKRFFRIALLIILFFSSLMINPSIHRFLGLGNPFPHPEICGMVWDIIGINKYLNNDCFILLEEKICISERQAQYDASDFPWKNQWFNSLTPDDFLRADSDTRINMGILYKRAGETYMIWLNAIMANPMAFLKHRYEIAKIFLGINGMPRSYLSQSAYPQQFPHFKELQKLRYEFNYSKLNHTLYSIWGSFQLIFKFWFYIALSSVAIIAICIIKRNTGQIKKAFIIYVMVLANTSLVIIIPSADFRYGIFIIVGTILLISMFFNELLAKIRTPKPELPIDANDLP
ncbi:MAG: hypothetical protein LBJ14_10605 [Desulfarculales bacterium]|jgi:hypothetical protein|nr:hypothetical protein [Desulfarculales bacterium]